MKRLALLFTLLPFLAQSQITTYRNNQTLPYHEVLELYTMLDNKYENAKLIEEGMTDAGRPLHLFLINSSGTFNPEELHRRNECIILVNNGIHPGEPDGINACAEFSADILSGRIKL